MKTIVVSLLVILICTTLSYGESLIVVDSESLLLDNTDYDRKIEHWEHHIGAYWEGDFTLVGTVTGLYARFSREATWRKIKDCSPRGNSWWKDNERARRTDVLFYPKHFWQIPSTNDLVVFDGWMLSLYTLELLSNDIHVKFFGKFDNAIEKVYVSDLSIYNDQILVGIITLDGETAVAALSIDMSDYHRVFKCPIELTQRFDALGYGIKCYPEFNPTDSTIWIAFNSYDYLYVVGMDGQLLDSVQIAASDFRLPQPPRSRIKSKAVALDWSSKFTPVTSFSYVSPGYFLLQYRSGWENIDRDSIPLYSTVAWKANKQPVELAVDKHWQLAGVQPDGRLIFGRFVIEDDQRRIELYMGRIEP